MTAPELDISTGRPRERWDQSSEVYARYRDRYAGREGTVLRVLVVAHSGVNFGPNIVPRGTIREVPIPSEEFALTLDPATGDSWLLEPPDVQLAKHKHVRVHVLPDDYEPSAPEAEEDDPDADPIAAAKARYAARQHQRTHGGIERAWAEDEARRNEPLTIINAERQILKKR